MSDARMLLPGSGWRPGSLAIDASAGYGKTQILALRILALLLSGCAPSEFAAMTFSRAAAAEIYSRLLTMLSGALESPEKLAALKDGFRKECGGDAFSSVDRETLLKLLETLVREMPRLHISTLDSFFMDLVRCFPLELGLPGGAELLSEESEETVRAELLRRLFSGGGSGEDFSSICREMMFGEERKSLSAVCVEVLRALDPFYPLRNFDLWGTPWKNLDATERGELDRALRCCDGNPDWKEKDAYRLKLRPMLARCAQAGSSDTRFTRDEADVLRRFLAVRDGFPAEKPAGFAAGWSYSAAAAQAILILIEQGRRLLIHQAARRTSALREWYCRWCSVYAAGLWRRGRLQFADLPKLLRDDDPFARGDGSGEEWRREIEYRMNSRFRHFLLDEFQDTSRAQWSVLEPMTADPGDGEHSLFLVGDVKQAIYGWRSGDSKLIGETAAGMECRSLAASFRYGAEICAAINEIFGRIIPESGLIPAAVRSRWSDPHCFRPHASAADRPGRFEVLAPLADPDGAADYAEAAARLILARLRELDFRENKLDCAILCRSAREGIAIRDELVALDPGLADRILWEGNERIAGDPLVSALLAALIAVRHPAETAAAEAVGMYPGLARLMPSAPEEYAAAAALLDTGIAPFLTDLVRRLRAFRRAEGEGAPVPPENTANLELLLAAAAEFDAAQPGAPVRVFRDMMLRRSRTGVSREGTLRMLTVHHSKGLTFDVVFHPLPKPGRGTVELRRPAYGGMLYGGRAGDPDWLLFGVHAAEGAHDPAIRAAAEARHADEVFEELCVLYVALTRARYETVVILPPPTKEKMRFFHPEFKTTKSFQRRMISELPKESWYLGDALFEGTFSALCPPELPLPARRIGGVRVLSRVFGGDWRAPAKHAACPPSAPLAPPTGVPRPSPRRVTPSREAEETPRLFFSLPDHGDGGTDFGTRLHEYFASVDRLETAPPPADPAIAAELLRCRSSSEILAVVDESADEVWRERPFDVLIDDPESGEKVQLTGCFDRVHIRRAAAGAVLRARIIDYKSNRSGTLAGLSAHYAGQMRCYRAALAKLLGIAPGEIRCTLIFTRFAAVVELF